MAFLLLLFLSLLPLSFSLPSYSVPDAVNSLWSSNLTGMSLIIQYGRRRVTPTRIPSLTIFAPSDAVFEQYGQPSLDQLHLHYSPLRLTIRSLKSLRDGTKIPTLTPNRFLTISTSSLSSPSYYGSDLSINGVEIREGSRIYDDGSLVVFEVDRFFDPDFKVPEPSRRSFLPCSERITGGFTDGHSFKVAAKALRSRGYSIMASVLDTQVGRVGEGALLTVFAPADESLRGFVSDEFLIPSPFSAQLLLRHFVPCKVTWRDLAGLGDDTVQLQTYSDGFKINVTASRYDLTLNGVSVMDREIFVSNWLVVHGIRDVLASSKELKNQVNAAARSLSSSSEKIVKSGSDLGASMTFWFSMVSLSCYLFCF